ncbi:MAG: hypothetical protein ACM3PE_11030 [Deltaproteobacteria bacterium]
MLDHKCLFELQEYIDFHREQSKQFEAVFSTMIGHNPYPEIEDFIKNNQKPLFSQILFGLIDKKGVIDTEIYQKAGIDRRHFSKIRSNPKYHPSKNTVVALAMVLELDKSDADDLLRAAGYSLSDSNIFDLVIQFFLENKMYDIHDINQALDYFTLKPLLGELEQ